MIFDKIKRGYRRFFPKNYTVKELSDIKIEYLRSIGVEIGENVDIIDSNIDDAEPYLIKIGNNVTITGVRLLTHDASTNKELGYVKVGYVHIGDNVFVGAGSIILPGTKIGSNVIIGAGSVVAKDIPDNTVCGGNPVKVICAYDEYMQRQKERMAKYPVFNLLPDEIKDGNHEKEKDMIIKSGYGFIK
ncbi:MAG: acyltransferase [Clostridia bacterium]|nr:acyltransferase [Clostridia bacterium]